MEKMRGVRQDEAHALYELRRALAAAPAALRIQGDTVAVDETVFDLDVPAMGPGTVCRYADILAGAGRDTQR